MFARVYADSAASRLWPTRPVTLVVALVAGSLAAQLLVGSPAAATPATSQAPVTSTAFRLVVIPAERAQPVGPRSNPRPLAMVADGGSLLVRPTEPPAQVVRFRPRGGQTAISRDSQVSVRFTAPMDKASTQGAFAMAVNGSLVKGRYRWAENDTVLVFVPGAPFPYGATVTLSVTGDARSSDGTPIRASRRATFSVVHRPAARPAPSPTVRPSVRPHPSAAWRWPLNGPITQYFGQSLTVYGFHYGIDIDGQTGDRVRAARSGTVTVAGHWDSCGGIQVHIDHGGGFESWYRHLSQVDVSVGERISAGTLIGRVGATGCAFGSHLHFAIRLHGAFVDPLRHLPRR